MAKKIEISDSEVEKVIKSIKKFKRNSYWFFPIWFISSCLFIDYYFFKSIRSYLVESFPFFRPDFNDYEPSLLDNLVDLTRDGGVNFISLISLILSLIYFRYVLLKKTKFDDVKKGLIKKEKDRLDEIDKEKKEAKAKAIREKKEKERSKLLEEKEKERLKLLKEKEKKINAELLKSNERVYFSHSFVSEKSKLYLINSPSNQIIESSSTNALKLYSEGFRIIDIDKTGQSAQLDSFNFVIRFSKQ